MSNATRTTKTAPTGAAHQNRKATAQAAVKADTDANGRKLRGAVQGKKFGERNGLLCAARVAKRQGKMEAAKQAMEQAGKIAPISPREQAAFDRA